MTRGLFISIEGGDGAGKSTQVALLCRRLEDAGRDVVSTREPGGTSLGDRLRDLVKGGADPTPRAELLMFEAARAELVERVITPALERGATVVTDRFADSSLAYQAYGRGLDLEAVRDLNSFATGGMMPDLTVLLDAPPDIGGSRASGRDGGAGSGRRFEEQPEEFHRRVRQGYLALAKAEPHRWLVVDATKPAERVADVIWQRVSQLLSDRA